MVTRFTHLGIAVHDIDAATAAWCERFGLVERHRIDTVIEGFRTVLLITPDDPDGFAVELIAAIDPNDATNQVVRFLAKHGEGLFHLAGTVRDVGATADRLSALGAGNVVVPAGVLGDGLLARIDDQAPRVVVSPRSATGVLVELLQERTNDNEGAS